MKLSPRLQVIADFVSVGDKVADIGTDHGYIPIYLIEKNISNCVVAADINEGPLESAKNMVEKYSYEEQIHLRLGSGMEVLEAAEVDTVIIAGMGGVLISELLQHDLDKSRTYKRFILQPMVAQDDLRKYLYENGFKIIDEKLAREGEKYYEIMLVEHGDALLEDEIYLEVSHHWMEPLDPLFDEYLDFKIKKAEKIYKNISTNSSNDQIAQTFSTKLQKLKELRR